MLSTLPFAWSIKEFFSEKIKKISSKIILLEIGNEFLNVALAKSQNNKLYIKKVSRVVDYKIKWE